MKYGIAWLLGVPGSLILLWFLANQAGCGFYIQTDRVAGLGQLAFGIFFPMLGELTDFHSDLHDHLLVAGRDTGTGR